MKKFTLKTLLVAVALGMGANAWGAPTGSNVLSTMTGIVGPTDNTSTAFTYGSKVITIAAGETYEMTFVNYNAGSGNKWNNWILEGNNGSLYFDFRADGGYWGGIFDGASPAATANYTGSTHTTVSGATTDVDDAWMAAYNGVTVTLTATRSNDGKTIAFTHSATTNTSVEYSGTFTVTLADASSTINFYITNEASHQLITNVTYTNSTGGTIYTRSVHTAGAKWGSGYDGTYESTVDAAAEFYNTTTTSWRGAAYAKFAYSLPASCTVTSATLTYNTNQGGSNTSRTDKISYMSKDFDIDWANFAGQKNVDLSYSTYRNDAVTVATGGTGVRKNLTGDVTAAVRAIYAGSQDYILFQWSENAGAANLYGNGATDYNAPQLQINYSNSVLYEATFTENNSLTPNITVYTDEERTSTIKANVLEANTTYYFTAVLEGYNDYEGSFGVTTSNPTVNFTMTAKPRYTFTVNAVNSDGGATIQVLYTDDDSYDGKAHRVYFPAYLTGASNVVTYSKANSTYYADYVSASGDPTKTQSYTAYTGNAWFYEGENVEGRVEYTTGTFAPRSSSGSTGVLSEKTITNLAAGSYKISARVIGKAGSTMSMYKTSKSGENIFNVTTSTSGAMGVGYITLDAATDIVADGGFYTSTDNGYGFDYILIEEVTSVTATIGATGYTTFASPYALNLSSMTASTGSVAAYYASAVDESSVTLTSTDATVEAGTGLMLKGSAGATVTIPVAASGSAISGNMLVGCTANTNVDANSDFYVLVSNEGTAEFQRLDQKGATIPAGKAYLNYENGAGAKLRIAFAGDATGIEAIASEGAEDDMLYNIAGQKVSKSYKGFVINSKGQKFYNK